MTTGPIPSWRARLWQGLRLGAIAGLVLATGYTATAIPTFGLVVVLANAGGVKALEAMLGIEILAACAWPFAVFLGILPGTALGAAGGLLLGAVLGLCGERLPRKGGAVVGALVAGLFVLGLHWGLAPGLLETPATGLAHYVPYLFWVFGPSALLMVGLSWVGWKLKSDG